MGEDACGGATVLVVDDEASNRLLAEEALKDEGYRVVSAKDGAEALKLFGTDAPDCVLLDVRMPQLDGFSVCRRMRELPGGKHIPILFATALRDIETFDTAYAAGGDDFLLKPFRVAELVSRVATAIARSAGALAEAERGLKQQRDALVRLQLEKERLTAFIVHDLKNPVHALSLQAQLILRQAHVDARVRNSVECILAEASQLNRMISNLLDVAKASEGKLQAQIAAVDVPPLIESVFVELAALAATQEVTLRVESCIERVQADPELVRRVLVNLLENAVRHTAPGTAVRVRVARNGAEFELSVADAGPGIPPELREQVFEPFYRGANNGSPLPCGGRGLGLAFCREAARAHGGRIGVEDGSPGSVFRMSWTG